MGKKLKIGFLSRFFGKVNRGVETYVLELSKRLSKHHSIDVLTDQDSENIRKYVNKEYDLVIPTNGRMQAMKASIGRIIGNYQTLISGQAGVGIDDIFNIFITVPNVYVALTEYEKNWANKWATGTKIVKIPNGVDLDKFSPSGPVENIDLEKPIIMSVGALEWYKYHERTVKALKLLNKGSLLIIGSGSQKERLDKLGKEMLGKKRFKILSIEYEYLPAYYRAANLFVLPSWSRESFGIVYVEAMASGVPVVAPDDPSRREIVGSGGIFTKVDNTDEYARAIKEALNQKWNDKPRKQAEKFSWDIIAQKYNNLFEEMFK